MSNPVHNETFSYDKNDDYNNCDTTICMKIPSVIFKEKLTQIFSNIQSIFQQESLESKQVFLKKNKESFNKTNQEKLIKETIEDFRFELEKNINNIVSELISDFISDKLSEQLSKTISESSQVIKFRDEMIDYITSCFGYRDILFADNCYGEDIDIIKPNDHRYDQIMNDLSRDLRTIDQEIQNVRSQEINETI